MVVVRWWFDFAGGWAYHFERNPDRQGGDTGWKYELRYAKMDYLGGSSTIIHTDGFRSATRTLKFTAVTGTMMRTLSDFYQRKAVIGNCSDHLYGCATIEMKYVRFNCFMTDFTAIPHPTLGTFPGSLEDTWDVEMTILKVS